MKPALVLVAATLFVSSCGGGGKPAASVADVAPFTAVGVLSGSPDRVSRALALIPDGPRLIALLARARAASGGGERVVLLDPSGRHAVAIVRSADTTALDRAGIVHANVRGWIVFSRSRASVDAVRRAKRHLVDTRWYRPASGDVSFVLPALTLTATRHGDRQIAERTSRVGGLDAPQALAARIPGDAVAAAAFQDGAAAFRSLSFGPALERGVGLRLVDLAAAAPGGGVVFARPGLPVPTVTLLARGGTLAAARRLVRDLDRAAPLPEPAELDGAPLQVVHLGALDLYYGRVDDMLVVTDDPELRLRPDSALAPDGLPERTSAWAYLDVPRGLPGLTQLASLAGTTLSPTFVTRVTGLRSVLVYRAQRRLVVVAR